MLATTWITKQTQLQQGMGRRLGRGPTLSVGPMTHLFSCPAQPAGRSRMPRLFCCPAWKEKVGHRPYGTRPSLFMKGCRTSIVGTASFSSFFRRIRRLGSSRSAEQRPQGARTALNNLLLLLLFLLVRAPEEGSFRPSYSFDCDCLWQASDSSRATRSRPVRAAQIPRGLTAYRPAAIGWESWPVPERVRPSRRRRRLPGRTGGVSLYSVPSRHIA